MRTRQHETTMVVAQIERPSDGLGWKHASLQGDFKLTGKPAWQSNGGTTRGHSFRSLPFSFESRLAEYPERLLRVHLIGVFALFADRKSESYGSLGATIQLLGCEREILARFDLINGRHYGDASDLKPFARVIGDGTSVDSVGQCELHGDQYRVDVLTLDVHAAIRPKFLLFKDLGGPASFVIFDVFLEYEGGDGNAAQGRDAAATLNDLGAAIRLGDRIKFGKTLDMLDSLIDEAADFDEARGFALAFLGVIATSLLENASSYPVHRLLWEAAQGLELDKTRSQVKESIRERIAIATDGLFNPSDSPADRLVDRALAIVERHYAKDITDSMVAAQLGLSTSHFRFLFRQATGHPFHKYVVALRLEKAKQMLIEEELPISQVATAVGFTGLSHFSRAFTQRFSASPSHIRRAAG